MKSIFNSLRLKSVRRKLRHNLTEAEIKLWSRLRKSGLGYKFRRQFSVGNFILDFYCPKLRLAIEIDGKQHTTSENREYDYSRTDFLEEYNIKVLRFENYEVINNLDQVCNKILDVINNIGK